MKYLLGIDFGGGASKATLLNTEGNIVAENTVEYPTLYPCSGACEQDPKDWIGALCENTQALLQKSGIEVSPSLLAVKNDSAKSFTAEYDREEYLMMVAAFLLGSTPKGAYLLPNGIRAEGDNGDTVYVYSDMTVSFTADGIDEKTLLGAPITDEALLKATRDEIASLLGYSEGALDAFTVYSNRDISIITISQTEGGIPLDGFDCTFAIRDGRIVHASGKHFFGVFGEESESPLLNRVNILLSEKSRGVKGTVKSIDLCYILYEDTKLGMLHLKPAYSVTYADGKTSIIDAQSAKVFE